LWALHLVGSQKASRTLLETPDETGKAS